MGTNNVFMFGCVYPFLLKYLMRALSPYHLKSLLTLNSLSSSRFELPHFPLPSGPHTLQTKGPCDLTRLHFKSAACLQKPLALCFSFCGTEKNQPNKLKLLCLSVVRYFEAS